MSLPRPASPSTLLADIRALVGERSRHQVVAAIMAVVMPIAIVVLFIVDGKTHTVPVEQIIYVKSWSLDRTDAEIIADQKKAQAAKEARQKERQRQFKELDDRLNKWGL